MGGASTARVWGSLLQRRAAPRPARPAQHSCPRPPLIFLMYRLLPCGHGRCVTAFPPPPALCVWQRSCGPAGAVSFPRQFRRRRHAPAAPSPRSRCMDIRHQLHVPVRRDDVSVAAGIVVDPRYDEIVRPSAPPSSPSQLLAGRVRLARTGAEAQRGAPLPDNHRACARHYVCMCACTGLKLPVCLYVQGCGCV